MAVQESDWLSDETEALPTEEKVNFVQSCVYGNVRDWRYILGWEWVGGSCPSCEELK